jgi:hypothetical protein
MTVDIVYDLPMTLGTVSIFYAFSVGLMNWFVREKDDYMFLYESYYLFSYIIDISVDFEPHF